MNPLDMENIMTDDKLMVWVITIYSTTRLVYVSRSPFHEAVYDRTNS